MTITRQTQLEIIGYMVATSGEECKYFGKDGRVSHTSRVLSLPVSVVCDDDERTEVEVLADGTIEITGWDGNEGLGDTADTFTDEEIERVYNALYDQV